MNDSKQFSQVLLQPLRHYPTQFALKAARLSQGMNQSRY